MFEGLGSADQAMLFANSVVLIKQKLVFVHGTGANWKVETLRDGKIYLLPSPLKDVSPPYFRLGMVNTASGAVYAARTPTKQYIVGYNANNVRVRNVSLKYKDMNSTTEAVREAQRLRGLCFYNCLKGKYPTIDDAFLEATETNNPVAFDKQFAIDYNADIVFKDGKKVGAYAPDLKKILFIRDKEHLSLCLPEGLYEKSA